LKENRKKFSVYSVVESFFKALWVDFRCNVRMLLNIIRAGIINADDKKAQFYKHRGSKNDFKKQYVKQLYMKIDKSSFPASPRKNESAKDPL
jgi:hypothetical protein